MVSEIEKKFEGYNIILINLDGMRSDSLDICKTLKEISKKSLYFPNMISVSPYTLAAHHSIITGLYPSEHGVDAYHSMFKFKNDVVTLPEILKRDGFFTACNVASERFMPEQGFDKYNVFDEYEIDYKTEHKKLLRELSNEKRFFLFLQYSKLHTHLVKEVLKKYDETNENEYFNNIEKNKDRFDSHLDECDDVVDHLINTLKEFGLYEKTILIFTADHGTSCGEKIGENAYGTFLYDYTLKVFCIIHIPNEDFKIISNQCSSLDLFPTVVELSGLSTQKYCSGLSGTSLVKFIDNPEPKNRLIFSETGGLGGPWPSPKKHNIFCVRSNDSKLIYNDTSQTWEFYDLKQDPDEKNNIYSENLEIITKLKNHLVHHLKILNKDTKLI